jgi:choline-sulfatase
MPFSAKMLAASSRLTVRENPDTRPTRRAVAGSLLGCAAAYYVTRARAADKPLNVVILICDQMRGDALGFLGSPNARTPNLNRLAANGVSFDNYFVNNPVCMPSRKSVFSGLYPHQHGSLTNRHGKPLEIGGTMIDYFKQRGYRMGYIGKNHTYVESALLPLLDTADIRDREPFRAYNRYVPPEWHSDTYWPSEECYAWRNTDKALRFFEGARDRNPFFLTVSYFDPHPPYMAPPEYTSRYHSDQMKLPEYIAPSALGGRLEDYCRAMKFDRIKDSALTETMRYYYASIEAMVDHQVGRIMTALSDRRLLENTVVLFTSDHGDFMGQHRAVRKAMFLYDALLHVPMIWHVPGVTGHGRQTQALAQGIDIFPTLVDLTGGKPNGDLPGRSLKPLFDGRSHPDAKSAIFTSAGYGEWPRELVETNRLRSADPAVPLHTLVEDLSDEPQHRQSMIRTREWKLLLSESRSPELYRMNDGWMERKNLGGDKEYAGIRRELEGRLLRWWRW